MVSSDRFLEWVGTRGHFDFYELSFAGLIGAVVTMILSAVLDGILRHEMITEEIMYCIYIHFSKSFSSLSSQNLTILYNYY